MPKKNMIISGTLLILLAMCNTSFAQGAGDQYVRNSLKMLLTANTIECDLRIETFVDGREYPAIGSYKEQALQRTAPGQPTPFLRSMYRLDIMFFPSTSGAASNAEPNRMTLVCHPGIDGQRGQVERQTYVEGVRSFKTIDLTRLEQRLQETNNELYFTQVSEVRNLGGLAGMMRQIARFYEFETHGHENLQNGEMIPALKLTGKLRAVLHSDLLKRFGGLDKQKNYPADFPSDMELWLGRINEFPYKIRYLRRISEHSEQKELLFQETFTNVIVNGTPIPASQFAPLPPPDDVFMDDPDDTDNFIIRALGL